MSSLFSYVWPVKAPELDQEMETIPKYETLDLEDISYSSLIHICAPGSEGKTTLTLDIIDQFNNKRHKPYVNVFCSDNGMFTSSAKYTEQPVFSFNPQMIEDLLMMNTTLHKLFVFEDTSIEGKDRRNTSLNKLQSGFTNNSTTIFTNQYVLDLPKRARENVDFAFVRPGCSLDTKSIFDNYGKWCFKDYQQFSEAIGSLNKFQFLVLRKNGKIYTYTPNKRN